MSIVRQGVGGGGEGATIPQRVGQEFYYYYYYYEYDYYYYIYIHAIFKDGTTCEIHHPLFRASRSIDILRYVVAWYGM